MVTVTIAAQNDAPVADLNGAGAGTSTTLAYTENGPVAAIAPGATVADFDTISFNGARLQVTITNGSNTEDVLSVINQGTGPGQVGYSNGTITYEGVAVAQLLPRAPASRFPFLDIQFNFSGAISPAAVQAVMRAVGYQNSSDAPSTTPRNVSFSLSDGGVNGLGTAVTATINLTAVNDAPVARPDAFIALENAVLSGSVFPDNGSGADSDVDGPAIQVGAVNGSAVNVGTQITLASGALLTVNANGTFSYNPNNAFNALADFAGSGASNTTAPDSFTYALVGGNTVTVTLTVRGVDSNGDVLLGTAGDGHAERRHRRRQHDGPWRQRHLFRRQCRRYGHRSLGRRQRHRPREPELCARGRRGRRDADHDQPGRHGRARSDRQRHRQPYRRQ